MKTNAWIYHFSFIACIAMDAYLYNNIALSMLYAEICPKVRRHDPHIIVIITLNVFGDLKN
jgi:hypothetical protein